MLGFIEPSAGNTSPVVFLAASIVLSVALTFCNSDNSHFILTQYFYESHTVIAGTFRTLPGALPGDILTSERAANYLGVERSTLDSWRRERGLPALKISGKVVLFSRAALDHWVSQNAIQAAAK